jgi:hypothetical protein
VTVWSPVKAVDWSLTREDSVGVGAGARFRAKGAGRHPWIEVTVVESVRPERTVEHGRGGKGMLRHTTGVYELRDAPNGATRSPSPTSSSLPG